MTDVTGPTVTINQAGTQPDPTTQPSVMFTVVFSETVGDFATGDVTVSGTAGATTAAVTGSGTTYTVAISGITQSGTVIASIAAGVAHDANDNANTASTSTDNTVTFTQPTIAVPTAGGTVQVTVITGGVLTAASGAAPQVPPPNGVTFPFGQLSFTAVTPQDGLVVFQLTLPSPVTTYYKLVGGAWQQFTFDNETGFQVSGNTVTVTVRDNGRGDSDATSGVVTDPGAPAVPTQVPPPTTTPTSTTTPTTAPGALPPTGSSSTNNLLVLGSLTLGVGLLLADARRRRTTSIKA
jgi:LPXTG-motif cell wall-anchored protein